MDDPSAHEPRELGAGFPGERMRVLPEPLVAAALAEPALRQLLVTDAGYFPHAARHVRRRERGSRSTVVIVCQSGYGACTVAGVEHRIGPGDAVVISPGHPHVYEADAENPWTIWWWHMRGSATADLVAATGATAAEPVLTLGDVPRVLALVDTVIRRMERDETRASLLAAAGAAWNAMALLAAERRAPSADSRELVDVTIEHVRANPTERLPVARLAAMAGLSPSHYAVVFKRRTGFGVLEFQTRLRMAQARELLDTTDLPIATIARRVGYTDPLYFSRQFRRYHLTAPRAYRGRESR